MSVNYRTVEFDYVIKYPDTDKPVETVSIIALVEITDEIYGADADGRRGERRIYANIDSIEAYSENGTEIENSSILEYNLNDISDLACDKAMEDL